MALDQRAQAEAFVRSKCRTLLRQIGERMARVLLSLRLIALSGIGGRAQPTWRLPWSDSPTSSP